MAVVVDGDWRHRLVDMESLEALEEALDEADIVHTQVEEGIVAVDKYIAIEEGNDLVRKMEKRKVLLED